MNHPPHVYPWIRAALALALAALAAGCGGKVVVDGGRGDGTPPDEKDACTRAIEHLVECVPGGVPTEPPGECTGINLCASECLVEASCDAILGNDLDGAQELGVCVLACEGTDDFGE